MLSQIRTGGRLWSQLFLINEDWNAILLAQHILNREVRICRFWLYYIKTKRKQTIKVVLYSYTFKRGHVFQRITLFLATPAQSTLSIRCNESRSGHLKQRTLAVLFNWTYFLKQFLAVGNVNYDRLYNSNSIFIKR